MVREKYMRAFCKYYPSIVLTGKLQKLIDASSVGKKCFYKVIKNAFKTKGLTVVFPVRAPAWVAGQVPSRGRPRCNHMLMFLSLSFSFLSPLSGNQ